MRRLTPNEQYECDALHKQLGDLERIPCAHEVYKGNAAFHLLVDSNAKRNSSPSGVSFQEHYADQVLDFYQAFDRRIEERKEALIARIQNFLESNENA